MSDKNFNGSHARIRLAIVAAGLAITLIPPLAPADDIDLFIGNKNNQQNPNILIIMDNAASNNASMTNPCSATQKKLDMEQCTLAQLINSTQVTDSVNIGLAAFNPSGSTSGGYIVDAVRQMTSANKTTLVTGINALQDKNHNANNAPYALSLYEAYLYFAAGTPYVGTQSTVYDSAAVSAGKYVSPNTDSCQHNYIIFIGNGTPDSSEDKTMQPLLAAAPLNGVLKTDPIPLTPNNYQSNWGDETTRTLFKNKLEKNNTNIITYTVAVHNTADKNDGTNPNVGGRALLKSMAAQGGGKYFDVTDQAGLIKAITDIFAEVISVNTVFASATLPVSVNMRGANLNQIYMGVFRPDPTASPRWMGNLKEYQLLADSNGKPFMADSLGKQVENTTTGFVNPSVVSYWTAGSTFWSFNPNGYGGQSDSADGDVVEKGAEAEWLRTKYATSQSARPVYTCTGSTCVAGANLSATPFSTANTSITKTNTGTTASTDPADLINWMRGTDLYDENVNASTTDIRASIHGDVLHSRPAVVNYNRDGTDNDVFVYYGANDGMLHAIKGGQASDGGTEQWSFIAPEHFGTLKVLRDNAPTILAPNKKPYFFDGPVTAYTLDGNNDKKLSDPTKDAVQIFAGMRRGGQAVYSFDVLNPGTPKFVWKKTSSDTGYAELAQTWSAAQPVKIHASSHPVVVMGAGYDPAGEDLLPRGIDNKGRGIMVIDVTDGSVLWQAGPNPTGATTNVKVTGMTYSFPSDVRALDTTQDGYADRIYAVDAGANIWRVDIDDANPTNWTVTQLAQLGGTGSDDRKFLYPPAVVLGGTTNPFDALLIGSGDREKPFDTTIANRLYMIKDPNTGTTVPSPFTTITESDLYNATSDLVQSSNQATAALALSNLNSAKGWFIKLATGEKTVGSSTVLAGDAVFVTNTPTANQPGVCNNLGLAQIYQVNYLSAGAVIGTTSSSRAETIAGGGFLPSPVAAAIPGIGDVFCVGTHCEPPPGGTSHRRTKIYWHNDRDK